MAGRVRPPYYVLGVHGLAVLRTWISGDEVAAPRVAALRDFAEKLERQPLFDGLEIAEYDVAAGYARWSDTYDDPTNPLVSLEQPVVRSFIDELPRGRALDAACGTGRHTAYLVERGFDTTGLDATPEMLAQARKKIPNAKFVAGNLSSIDFPDATFDVIVCALALDHSADIETPVREFARIARPGAAIIISVFHPMSAMLGGGAFFRGENGHYGIVASNVYGVGDYVNAFVRAGLEIRACVEPEWGEREISMTATARMAPAVFANALVGIPCGLIFRLSRP